MTEVKRYTFKGAAGYYVYAADFDRVASEVSALQQCLNIADQRVCDLTADGLQSLYDDTQARLIASMKDAKDLESELTKARELLSQVNTDYIQGPNVPSKWFERRDEFLAHQSAPAANGEPQ